MPELACLRALYQLLSARLLNDERGEITEKVLLNRHLRCPRPDCRSHNRGEGDPTRTGRDDPATTYRSNGVSGAKPRPRWSW